MNKQQSTNQPTPQKADDEGLDDEFIKMMLIVEQKYQIMTKHEKIRIEQWTEKLCQVTSNSIWKKNRNQYAKQLLDNVLHSKLELPFSKMPPEGPLPKYDKIDILTQRNSDTKPVQLSKLERLEEIKKRTMQMSPRQLLNKSPSKLGSQSPRIYPSTQQPAPQKNLINQYLQQSPLNKNLQKNIQQSQQFQVDSYKTENIVNQSQQTPLQNKSMISQQEYYQQQQRIDDLCVQLQNYEIETRQLLQMLQQSKNYLEMFNQNNVSNQFEVDLFIQKLDQERQIIERRLQDSTFQKQQYMLSQGVQNLNFSSSNPELQQGEQTN